MLFVAWDYSSHYAHETSFIDCDWSIDWWTHCACVNIVQGPALYAYNNAIFTESDWKGIRMLQDSIKETDLMTIGQFGLGFKSVFHVTGTTKKHLLFIIVL